jgi:hypothetical protein
VAFFKNFPQGVKTPGKDVRPPDELDELIGQENAVALRYRDLLLNDLGRQNFKKMVDRIHTTLGLTLR